MIDGHYVAKKGPICPTLPSNFGGIRTGLSDDGCVQLQVLVRRDMSLWCKEGHADCVPRLESAADGLPDRLKPLSHLIQSRLPSLLLRS